LTEQRKRFYLLGLVWAATAFFIWPILRHRTVLSHRESRTIAALILGYAIAVLICYCFYRAESRRLGRSRNLILIVLIFLLTCFTNQIHHYFVDQGTGWSSPTNTVWQERLQIDVANLFPGVVPHSYRFLPNGIVLWMQICRIRYQTARDIYRLWAGLLLFFALYRYARHYTDYLGGLLTLLLVALVYPMSFEAYAGQLTDPLSHLSFVLAFIFLETGDFAFLISTLLIGSLAKETVLALAGFYVLFCRSDPRYPLKAVTLCVSSLAFYFGVRYFVLHGTIRYVQISHVDPHHVIDNLTSADWPLAIVVLLGYMIFLLLGWKETPRALKRMTFFLLPVLLISNLFFGWLRETRNYMPIVFVLSVVAARYLSRRVVMPDASVSPIEQAVTRSDRC
jgi:hypothetical protein